MLTFTSLLEGMGLSNSVSLVTDGRFSGTSGGPCIGHLSPEAMDGGPIALIRDGDIIEIDIPTRKINVDLSEEEMARRREQWRPPEPKVTHGWLAHFAKYATSADKGAYLE